MSKVFSLKKNKDGFLVLTMVLLVSAVVLAVATGVMLRSISEVNASSDSEKSLKAWGAVNACGEYALLQISTTTGGLPGWQLYTGAQSLAVSSETCYIYSIGSNGSAKVILASSTVSGFTRKVRIEVATNTPSLVVNYWNLVADF